MKKIARGILVLTFAVLLVFSSVAIGLAQEEKIIEPSVTPTATASMEPTPTVSTEPTPTVSAEPTPTTSTEVAPVPTESAESMNGIELSPNESSTPTHSTENSLSSPSALVDIEANPLTGAVTNLRWAENIDSTEQTVNANIGEAVTLTVPAVVNDDPVNYPIQYQWCTPMNHYGDGTEIQGATNPTYTTPAINTNTSYRCEIRDGSGTVLYYYVTVNCGTQLYWKDGKDWGGHLYVKRGDSLRIDATAGGGNATSLQYQWYKDDQILSGMNDAILQIESMQDADYGNYECKVTDGYNTISKSWFVQDDSILVWVDKISISSDGITTIDGTATTKKTENYPEDFDVYLTGAWVVYYANGEYAGSDEIEFRIDELASWTDGQWSGSTTRTEDEDSITITFSMKLKVPYTLSEEQAKNYADISNGEFVRYIPKGLMTWNGSQTAYAEFSIPTADDFSVMDKASDDQSVKVQGNLPPNSAVVLGDVNANITGDMRKALQSNEELIWLKDISLEVDGEKVDYNGELNISILVGTQYNGQTMKILHYKDNGQIEELSGMVTDGYLTFTTTSLSPFGVVASDSDSAVPVAETVSDVPKTGDNAMPVWMLILIMAGAICMIAYTGIRQYHKSVK